MRKNINKLIAFAIGISVVSGSAIPVFAADSTITSANTSSTIATTTAQNTNANTVISGQVQTKPVLTLEAAIDAGLTNSLQLGLQIKKVKLEEDKLDIQDELDDSGYLYDSQELAVKQEKEKKEFLVDQIAQDITNEYNDIVAKDKELNKLKRDIDIKTKELNDNQLRKNLGLITSIDMKSEEIKLQTSKNGQKDKENKLKNAKDYFNVLTGKDLNKYTLEQDAKYEVFKITGSIDTYLDDVIEKYLRYNKESLKLTRDYVNDHKVSEPDKDEEAPSKDTYTSTGEDGKTSFDSGSYAAAVQAYESRWKTYADYLDQKYNISKGQVSLDDSKKNLKKGLKESYTSLLDLENSINVMKSNLEVNNKQLSVAKLKNDMGLITKTEYNKQVLANDELDTNLRTLIDNYNKLKNNIQKPWLIGNSTGV
jgi:hypothetical protein